MATTSRPLKVERRQRARSGRLRLAYVGICRTLDKRPHWSFGNTARDEPRGQFPWERLQEAVELAIDAGAAWVDVERFYLELMADARAHFDTMAVGPVSDREAYLAAVREHCEAMQAAAVAEAEGSESAIDRAIREEQEAVEAGQLYIRVLMTRQSTTRPQLAVR